MGFGDLISKVFDGDNQLEKVFIDQGVIDSAIYYSKKSYPDEFLAMFDGHVKGNDLYITSLLFLPGERSHTSASFNDWLIPPTQKIYGTIHSHPGNSASPSGADLVTFSSHGPFHIIVCEPYSLATMRAYDNHGNPTAFEVGNFRDSNADIMLEDLEEIKDSIDKDDELKPSFFDLDKDLSAFEDDDEKLNKYSHELDMLDYEVDEEYPSLNESSNFSNDDLDSFYNPREIIIGGEKVNGQSPNLGIVIEIRDGKPILKSYINEDKYGYDDSQENGDSQEEK